MSGLSEEERAILEPALLSENDEGDWLEDEVYPAVEAILAARAGDGGLRAGVEALAARATEAVAENRAQSSGNHIIPTEEAAAVMVAALRALLAETAPEADQ